MNDKTDKILKLLEDINKIPRGSGNREPVHNYFKVWAEKNNFSYKTDDAFNIIISVPPTPGFEKSPVIVLQGHMDMVCEKTPESKHDFLKDPIIHIIESGWLKAKETTLGADNGIALAMAMVTAVDSEVEHPPLELLFTTDEEIGLRGANEIKPEFVKGKILLNIDSEETGIFTTGCAGSSRTHIEYKPEMETVPFNYESFILKIGGLKGGHSALDITKSRGNACELLIRGLEGLGRELPFSLYSINGGSAMNAIARTAEAVITAEKGSRDLIKNYWKKYSLIIKSENSYAEKNISLECDETENPQNMIKNTSGLINKLRIIPHGIQHMDPELSTQIETSLNFGVMNTSETGVRITTMQRSSVKTRLDELTERIKTLASVTGGKYSLDIYSVPWQPDLKSDLLKRSLKTWKTLYNEEAQIEITHGGLECGVIENVSGGMETISFGPDIENPHSPDEKLKISSVGKVFNFLTELLISYK
jgi:dipeptidase D